MSKPRRQPRPNERMPGPDGINPPGFSEREIDDIQERSRLRAPMIYEVLRREGDEEMARPAVSLWWSGTAAGVSISFSLLAEGLLKMHLPDAPWRQLVVGMGYTVGFLIVVLGRQQLFTENTVTVVLPVVAQPTLHNFARLARMWALVLTANMAGTLFAALFCNYTPVLSSPLHAAMLDISRDLAANGGIDMFFRAIAAGFLIAAMVWLLPSAAGSQFLVISLMTYLIAIGGFPHLIAGSVEAFMLVTAGQMGVGWWFTGFFIPVLLGNVAGGTVLFAILSYAQVAKET